MSKTSREDSEQDTPVNKPQISEVDMRSQQYLSTILSTLRDAVIIVDNELKVTYLNEFAQKQYMVTPKEALGAKLTDLYKLFYVSKEDEHNAINALAQKEVWQGENIHIKHNGESIDVESTIKIIKDTSGKQTGLLAIIRDISEHKKAEEDLRHCVEKYRQIIEIAEEGIWMAKPDGVTLFVNPKMANMIGYSPDYFIDKVGTEFLMKDQEQIIVQTRKQLDNNNKIRSEYQFRHKNGTIVWTIGKVSPIFDENGQHIANLALHTNITDRKKAEEALKREHDELQTILDASPTWIFYKDKENRAVRVNKAFAEAMQLSKEQIEGHSSFEFFPKEQAEGYWKDDKQVMASGKPKLGIIEQVKIKDNFLWLKTDKIPYRDSEGNIIGVIGFAADITEQKERDLALRLQTLKFKLEDGNVYTVREGSALITLEAFKDLQKIGFDAVVISRMCEVDFKRLIGDYSSYYWLAEQGKRTLKPVIEELKNVMAAKNKNTVFLFDGLDYLCSKLGTQVIVSMIQWMREYAVYSGNIVLLPFNSGTFSTKELGLIEKETKPLEPKLPRISEELLEILRFVRSKNKVGVSPNHFDIQNAFGFSRPTLGRKLAILKSKEYLTETKMGNRKVVQLTQKAMNLLQL